MSRNYTVKGPAAILLVLILIPLFVLLYLVWMGLALGAANAWIIEGTFSDGWHAVWNRWPISLLWGLLFGGIIRWTGR